MTHVRSADTRRMLSVDEARERILKHCSPLPPERVPLLQAFGLVLAEAVQAEEPVPPFTNSAMDGYAVRALDTLGASSEHPVWLRVVGQVAAGQPRSISVTSGTAVRIMTGAVLPPGADAVVRFEDTDEVDSPSPNKHRTHVAVRRAASQGENVRPAGEDIPVGRVIFEPGTVLGPAHIGILAALGRSWVLAHRRPRVAILATGDEVVPPDQPLLPGQIRNSNSYTLACLVQQYGGEPRLLGIAADQEHELHQRLRAAHGADLLLTSGGVSQGDYDRVKDFLRSAGHFEIWQVRIKPGKPMAFGTINGIPVIALPGNPVASVVAFLQFARPAILRLQGRQDLQPVRVRATLTKRVDNRGSRRHFVRATLEVRGGQLLVTPVPYQGAAVLSGLIYGNSLAVIPEEWSEAQPGSQVEVEVYDLHGIAKLLQDLMQQHQNESDEHNRRPDDGVE